MVGGRGHLFPFLAADHKLFRFWICWSIYPCARQPLETHRARAPQTLPIMSVSFTACPLVPLCEKNSQPKVLLYLVWQNKDKLKSFSLNTDFSHPANTQVSNRSGLNRKPVDNCNCNLPLPEKGFFKPLQTEVSTSYMKNNF